MYLTYLCCYNVMKVVEAAHRKEVVQLEEGEEASCWDALAPHPLEGPEAWTQGAGVGSFGCAH